MNERIDDKPKSLPERYQIEEMLRKFNPQPSTRFYKMMQSAPWQMISQDSITRFKSISKLTLRKIVIYGVIILVLSVISFSFVPSIRALAREIISAFLSISSNQIEVQVNLTKPGDLFHFSDPENFPLSIEEVQKQAGFRIKVLQGLPDDLHLVGARFDSYYAAIILLYQREEYKLFLTQRYVGTGEDVFTIGSNAEIELVQIGENRGEFVKGGWKAVSTQEISDTEIPGSPISIIAKWDNDLPQSTLRWQENGFSYEIRIIGDFSFSQLELIALANGLK